MIFTSYEASKKLKEAGVRLDYMIGTLYYIQHKNKIVTDVMIDPEVDYEKHTRAFTLCELMALPEWREMDIVIFNSVAGFHVERTVHAIRVGCTCQELQSALDKCAELIAEQKGHPHA